MSKKTFCYDNSLIHVDFLDIESDVFRKSCYAVQSIDTIDEQCHEKLFSKFLQWLADQSVAFCSLKIPHGKFHLINGFIRHGFMFIETSVHPYLSNIPNECCSRIALVTDIDQPTLELVEQGASTCFTRERFHIDQMFDNELAGLRYQRFIRLSHTEPDQTLGVLKSPAGEVIGFTTWKLYGDMAILFLIGIMPAFQNKGYGKELWLETFAAMKKCGAKSIKTTVSMNNIVSVHFHTKLGFRLVDPEVVLHYHAPSK